MKEITVKELKEMMDRGDDFQLIDVREPHEYDICNLDGELIPMGEIPQAEDRIARDKTVVIHCRSGARSGQVCEYFERKSGFTNLYNLKGGVLAWSDQIDPSMPKY
jgi:adenylyltransferase/sulfurtransferase